MRTDQQPKKRNYWCQSLCLTAAVFFVSLILSIAYFGGGHNLNSQSPAKNLIKKHNNNKKSPSESTQSDIIYASEEPFYPSEVEYDENREIISSDPSAASDYYNSVGNDDLIESMPYLIESSCSASPSNCGFKQYSGYLLANNNAEIHYWFIEAEEHSSTKPIFFWTNGGPGCSGMDGLLTEHGPWRATKSGQIGYNPYSWNTEVNMVYLEQPFGVGFSSLDADGDESVVGGDQNAADDMDAAIRDFIKKFPSFANNKIYLSSESWGGHYIPMTAYTILRNNDEGKTPFIDFGGFLLGNPSTDPYENKYGFVGDIYGHGLLKSTDWYKWYVQCSYVPMYTSSHMIVYPLHRRDDCWNNEDAIDSNAECSAIHTRAYYSAYNANVYALDYRQCAADEDWQNAFDSIQFMKDAHLHRAADKSMRKVLESENYDSLQMGHIKKKDLLSFHGKLDERLNRRKNGKKKMKKSDLTNDEGDESEFDIGVYEPCIAHFMTAYLNLDEVQKALNVKPTEWEMCSDVVWNAWPDSDFESHIQPYYTQIINNYVDKLGLTLCVYSGDDDSVCGLQGTMYWLDRWGFDANSKEQWSEWRDDDQQLGGYYTQYMANDDKVGLHFLTVRSAGHMVPTTQPGRALTILQKYLYKFAAN